MRKPAKWNRARPTRLRDGLSGLALAAGAANVIMQLSRLPVGYGVVESKVDSGNLFKHPVKRTRTTLAFLMIAIDGTPAERQEVRRQINKSHVAVRSSDTSPVEYNAFDPDLQLWVASCIYRGVEDTHRMLYGEPDPSTLDTLYQEGKRFGTTLQVTDEMWPADRVAFEEYWTKSLELVEIDDTTREHLLAVATFKWLPWPVGLVLGRFGEFITTGFLPEPFREQMRLPWNANRQRRFDRLMGTLAAINRGLPRPLREFPLNLVLWDTRRRLRTGKPVI